MDVLESLISESGQGRRQADLRIPPAVQADRDREASRIRAAETQPGGGGLIPTSTVINRPADPVLGSLVAETRGTIAQPVKPRSMVDQIPGMMPQPGYKPPNVAQRILGIPETALTIGSGAAATLAAPAVMVGTELYRKATGQPTIPNNAPESARMGQERMREIIDSLTYQPRTKGAQANVSDIGGVLDASKIAGVGPNEAVSLANIAAHGTNTSRVGNMLREVGVGKVGGASGEGSAIGAVPPKTAAGVGPSGEGAARATTTQSGLASAGAAAAANPDSARAMVASASPELREAVERTLRKGGVNPDVLQRRIDADSLPVRVHLSHGQATQDPGIISTERNTRGVNKAMEGLLNNQNKALIENTERIRDAAAPDIFATSKPELGQLLIDNYQAKDAALNAQVGAKYKALRDANGGQFPLDAKAFVESADKALHKQLLTDFVPSEIRKTLDRVKTEGMTFENFEALRTNLARIQRSSPDGNARAVAGTIRGALEEMPLSSENILLKRLADDARTAARGRFEMIETDPAYKAVVRGQASADNFVSRYIVGKDTKDVQVMMRNLDETGRQAVARGVVDYLREKSIGTTGNFSQAAYNRALKQIEPKLPVVFAPQELKQLQALGRVASYIEARPKGSYVNESNTLVGALAASAKEGAKNAAEGVANVKAMGIPIGTIGRNYLERRAINKGIDDPASGLLLRDVKP